MVYFSPALVPSHGLEIFLGWFAWLQFLFVPPAGLSMFYSVFYSLLVYIFLGCSLQLCPTGWVLSSLSVPELLTRKQLCSMLLTRASVSVLCRQKVLLFRLG